VLGLRLLSLHNLRFLIRLTQDAREAIERGGFADSAAATRKVDVGGFLILIVLFGAAWLLFIVPAAGASCPTRRCRTRSRSATRSSRRAASTAPSRPRGRDGEGWIATGVVVTLDRRAVAAVAGKSRSKHTRRPPGARLTYPARVDPPFHLVLIGLSCSRSWYGLLAVPGSPFHRGVKKGLDLQGGPRGRPWKASRPRSQAHPG